MHAKGRGWVCSRLSEIFSLEEYTFGSVWLVWLGASCSNSFTRKPHEESARKSAKRTKLTLSWVQVLGIFR